MPRRKPLRDARGASSKASVDARSPAVEAAMLAAARIARELFYVLSPSAAWTRQGSAPTPEDDVGLPYARATVFTLGEDISFSVWVDRTLAPGRADHPILCASFADEGERPWRLRDVTAGRVRMREYGPHDQERLGGFGGASTMEEDGNGHHYLSTYRRSGDCDVAGAVKQFAEFFRQWASTLEALHNVARRSSQGQTSSRLEGSLARLEGLVGELAVLRLLGCGAEAWVGPTNKVHDIETQHGFVEVKTVVGEERDPVLSRQQITCSSDERFFFALVVMPADALRLIAGQGGGKAALDPFVVGFRDGIRRYLAPTSYEVDDALLRALSGAVAMCSRFVSWHRLRVPDEWAARMSAIEEYGDVVEFRQRCPRAWFVPCERPTL